MGSIAMIKINDSSIGRPGQMGPIAMVKINDIGFRGSADHDSAGSDIKILRSGARQSLCRSTDIGKLASVTRNNTHTRLAAPKPHQYRWGGDQAQNGAKRTYSVL